MIQTWRLDTNQQTLVLAARERRLPVVVYWGAVLPQGENLSLLYHTHLADITGAMLGASPEVSICPEAARSFPGQPGMVVRSSSGAPLFPQFEFAEEQQNAGDLQLIYRSAVGELEYHASFSACSDNNLFVATVSLQASERFYLEWLAAPVVAISGRANELIDFSGHWCSEFQEVRSDWPAGIRMRENRTGRSSHEHFPGLMVPLDGATNSQGDVYAFHYAWSGGHRMLAEALPDGQRQVQFGNATGIELSAGNSYQTAPLYLTYSNHGSNGCARSFQRQVRSFAAPNQDRTRKVHYNCWEAVFFDHNITDLIEIAKLAAKLGAERFVLDDGWFKGRDDDTRALGDWQIDEHKFPAGFAPLIKEIQKLGMSFGLWFEPEMISQQSELYQQNPHWVLGASDQIQGRNQLVLNLALPEVGEFLFTRIAMLLREYQINYIKWDHNRVLPYPDAAQTRATYRLLDRFRTEFPDLEIETCASGGGRIDFSILERCQRVWLSDSNDAIERARIQYNSALFLPACVTGSHVGPRSCHTSGRVHDISFRAWVAAQRQLGFELDPRELTQAETSTLTAVTKWWKHERDWLMQADILRLVSHDPAILAEMHLASDEQKFVIFVNRIASSAQISPIPLTLCALDQAAFYQLDLVNRNELTWLSRGQTQLKSTDIIVSGQYLMQHGVMLPCSMPNQTWVIKGVKQR